ncbi:MAG: hypothetical protein M1833_006629 [Piccolia ochrophora]|nr:MAG: hypothetical protein M1833_006629 [Piccolia ochrophora]
MSKGVKQHESYDPVSPTDFTGGVNRPSHTATDEKKIATFTSRSRTSSNSSSTLSLKPPRTPRFAEATAVNSPIEPSSTRRNPFADPPITMSNEQTQPQPSDVGFGYLAENDASRHATYPTSPGVDDPSMPKSPLKSAMKTPGTPARKIDNPLSPTFKEEQVLDKHESSTDKVQAQDLKVKFRVRLAKMVLRGVNFSCSLIVVSMLAATFTIFNATKNLAPRSGLPAWAPGKTPWPQIVLITIAGLSLLFSIVIFWAYFRGGHRRAEKVTVYYTVFAVVFFATSIIVWAVGAGVLNGSKANGEGKDVWGWSCKDNNRKKIFQEDVSYDLVCRLNNWALICCIIEIVVEVLTIAIYAVVFYRFWSKRKLRKSMDVRDKARSDLYLAQLRTQSAPNTPGFGGPMSPRFAPGSDDTYSKAEEGGLYTPQFASKHESFSQPKPFTLQPPPIKVHSATPQTPNNGFEAASIPPPLHSPAAPGEQSYETVPIPGAYASPLQSPTYQPQSMSFGPPGQAITTEGRVESPPGSPRLPPPASSSR